MFGNIAGVRQLIQDRFESSGAIGTINLDDLVIEEALLLETVRYETALSNIYLLPLNNPAPIDRIANYYTAGLLIPSFNYNSLESDPDGNYAEFLRRTSEEQFKQIMDKDIMLAGEGLVSIKKTLNTGLMQVFQRDDGVNDPYSVKRC